jgi:signal transduction histidine kinase
MNWFKSSQFRLSLFFLAGVMVLFGLLGIIVVKQGQRSFQNTVRSIQIQQQPNGSVFVIPNLLDQQASDDNGDLHNPQELFLQRFKSSLLWISLLGVGIALLLGVFISEYFLVKPLSRLQKGIRSVRKREYESTIQPTGLPEFDEVGQSFNELSLELSRVETLRRDLISDTSHELKTPLTALQVQLEGMRDGLITLDTKRVGLLLEHVDRLNDLTERLQEYARVRNRTASMELQPLHLRKLLEKIVADQGTELEVMLDVDDGLTLQADKHLFEQVLSNIVRNAALHAEATKLLVTYSDKKITFADNGKGVPKEAMAHLFERFYRVDASAWGLLLCGR